ncbi:MAG: pectin-derived oligosaccharide transport system permease protein, partial [Pseudonocardiales bacterium]|nr:pectin-derived oligosaccharide transport system permease protein [Pseudonocardiales bacterium]
MSALDELRQLRHGGVQVRKRDNKAAFWFLAPWFAGLVFITGGPVLASFGLGFTKYNLIQPPRFIGFDIFARIFSDERLHNALRVTFTYVLVSVP